MDQNRKTTIPVKSIPEIVEWIVKQSSIEELEWMSEFASDRKAFPLFISILTRLTEYNIHEVFYEKSLSGGEELMIFRAAKRGEVAGLKAFQMACQTAKQVLLERRKERNGKQA